MKSTILGILLCVGSLAVTGNALAQGGASHFAPSDTGSYNFNWFTSRVGGDLFATIEAYSFHFSRVGFFSITGAYGLGAEFRFRPLFIGGMIGGSGNEIRPQPSDFFLSSLYAGVIIDKYRFEVGKMYGETIWMDQDSPPFAVYKTYYVGVGRRYGSGWFIEPEIRLMIPKFATYYLPGSENYSFPGSIPLASDHYGLRDLFFAFSVRVGVGFN